MSAAKFALRVFLITRTLPWRAHLSLSAAQPEPQAQQLPQAQPQVSAEQQAPPLVMSAQPVSPPVQLDSSLTYIPSPLIYTPICPRHSHPRLCAPQ